MKTLYFECNMGASGDMIMAALLGVIEDKASFMQRMHALHLPGVRLSMDRAVKCGIEGMCVSVSVHGIEEVSLDYDAMESAHGREHAHEHKHEHEHDEHEHEHKHSHEHTHEHGRLDKHAHAHAHTGLAEITGIIEGLPVSEAVKTHALAIYRLIADAEAAAHGRPAEQIHFHEVGNLDAVADIVGACILMEQLAPDRILASPVHVGSGQVRCAHGILPVPTPATAYILKGVPVYGGSIRGELCTPTGAAILKHFVQAFMPMPVMAATSIGYGMGKKDFEAANCLRVFLGEDMAQAKGPNSSIVALSCNIDDMTGEAMAFATETLLRLGALDVYTVPAQMKKGRPGHLLVCLCNAEKADELAGAVFTHTTTFGIRKAVYEKYMLNRSFAQAKTPYGAIRIKTGTGYGVVKTKPEYEDIAKAARESGLGISDIVAAIT